LRLQTDHGVACKGSGGMAHYRLYCVDGAGKITRAQFVEAGSDEDAIMIVRSFKESVKCELWLRDRLIATIPPGKSAKSE
jgi:hypothetical protein